MTSRGDFSRALRLHRNRTNDALMMHPTKWDPQFNTSSDPDIFTAIRMKGRVALPLPAPLGFGSQLSRPKMSKSLLPDLIHPVLGNAALNTEDRSTDPPVKIESGSGAVNLTRKSNRLDLRIDHRLFSGSDTSSDSGAPSWDLAYEELSIYDDTSKLSPNTSFIIDHYPGEDRTPPTTTTGKSTTPKTEDSYSQLHAVSGSSDSDYRNYYIDSFAGRFTDRIPSWNVSSGSSDSFDSGKDISIETDMFVNFLHTIPSIGMPPVTSERCSTPVEGEAQYSSSKLTSNLKHTVSATTGTFTVISPPQIRIPTATFSKADVHTLAAKETESELKVLNGLRDQKLTKRRKLQKSDLDVESASKSPAKLTKFGALKTSTVGNKENSSRDAKPPKLDVGNTKINSPCIDEKNPSNNRRIGTEAKKEIDKVPKVCKDLKMKWNTPIVSMKKASKNTANTECVQKKSNIFLRPDCLVDKDKLSGTVSLSTMLHKKLPPIQLKTTSRSALPGNTGFHKRGILLREGPNLEIPHLVKRKVTFGSSSSDVNSKKNTPLLRCHKSYDPYKVPLTPDLIGRSAFEKKNITLVPTPPTSKKPDKRFLRRYTNCNNVDV